MRPTQEWSGDISTKTMAAADTIKPGWFSIEGAAIYTGFSVPTIRTAISTGTFPAYRVTVKAGSRKPSVRIRQEDLDRWIFGPTVKGRQWEISPVEELARIRAEVEELCRAVVALRESLPPANEPLSISSEKVSQSED